MTVQMMKTIYKWYLGTFCRFLYEILIVQNTGFGILLTKYISFLNYHEHSRSHPKPVKHILDLESKCSFHHQPRPSPSLTQQDHLVV